MSEEITRAVWIKLDDPVFLFVYLIELSITEKGIFPGRKPAQLDPMNTINDAANNQVSAFYKVTSVLWICEDFLFSDAKLPWKSTRYRSAFFNLGENDFSRMHFSWTTIFYWTKEIWKKQQVLKAQYAGGWCKIVKPLIKYVVTLPQIHTRKDCALWKKCL